MKYATLLELTSKSDKDILASKAELYKELSGLRSYRGTDFLEWEKWAFHWEVVNRRSQ